MHDDVAEFKYRILQIQISPKAVPFPNDCLSCVAFSVESFKFVFDFEIG